MVMMKLRGRLRSLIVGLALTLWLPACSTELELAGDAAPGKFAQAERPNFLIIVADDLGYSDLGAYGGEIDTPNLDQLARDGLMMTNYYVAGTCSPTRAMLLTGVDHHRAGLGTMVEHIAPNQAGQPGYEGYLNDNVVTVTERLRDAGYRTYMAGKWYIGRGAKFSPAQRGFDRSFALETGGASHFNNTGLNGKQDPAPYRENGAATSLPADFTYSTDFYTDTMISYLEEEKESGRPFFAYLAYTAPHWPLQARPEDIAKYEGRYDSGWEAVRQSRLARMQELGIVAADITLPEIATNYPAWEDLSDHTRAVEARRMEIFAAMVDRLDQQVGELIDYLKRTGQYDNTVIVFMSDNGNEGADLASLPVFADWIPRFDNSFENMGKAGSYIFIDERWAQVSNTPFRYFKGMPTDGGIRVPAFITFGNFANQRARYDGLLHVTDIAPTLYELAGIAPSVSEYAGRPVYPVIGQSILPALRSSTAEVRNENAGVGWELFNKMAYRRGDWKAVHMHAPWGPGEWQLFNLAADPGETTDLAAQHPEILAEIVASWEAYAADNGVILGNETPER